MTCITYQSSAEERAPPYESGYSTSETSDQQEWNANLEIVVCQSGRATEKPKTLPQTLLYMTAQDLVRLREMPANIHRKNVILFGETGVGKSSVINLMAGEDVALTSSNLKGCTLEATEYSFTLAGELSLRIYDTVGLNEGGMDGNTFFSAIEKAHKLITSLHDAGGVDLLLFCIRGGRITTTTQRNYRLFFEFLCEKKVPLAFVVTNLENEEVMEAWWERNEKTLEENDIRPVSHACITAVPARVKRHATKRAESRIALQRVFHDSLSTPNAPYTKDVRNWLSNLAKMLWSFVLKSLPASWRRKALLKKLESRCGLSRDEAQRLADMLSRGG